MIFSGYPYRDQVKRRKGVRVPTLKQCFTSGIYQSNTRMNDSTEGDQYSLHLSAVLMLWLIAVHTDW